MIYLTSGAALLLLILLIILAVSYTRMDRRHTETIRELRQRLSKAEDACKQINHSLNLAMINEISRIEQNIRQMDYSTKGVSNINNRILSMKAAYSSLGYEVPELCGLPYKQSDNHQVTMRFDETLKPGEAVVSKVIRPAVLFNGKMVQSANIIVSYHEN